MTDNYITLSLETHLFFARIMKEHALFLEAGFPCKNNDWIQKADSLRQQFEKLLTDVVDISNGRVNSPILNSDELVTEFTIPAEKTTSFLSGVPINTDISKAEHNLRAGTGRNASRVLFQLVHRLNNRSVRLLNELIDFKQDILDEVRDGNLFTFNYPLLIEHIQREAKLYRSTIISLMQNRQISYRELFGTENFWNRIMMEHALFIRGLLDPTEEALIKTANDFAMDYQKLLDAAKRQDRIATNHMTAQERRKPQNCADAENTVSMSELTRASLAETLKYQEFKTAGTKGILKRDIASIILPLLADHVLREANHYICILRCAQTEEDR